MMKNLYLLSFLFTCLIPMHQQAQIYVFSHSAGTYTPLSAPTTSINESKVWDGDSFTDTLGFNFNFYGSSYNSVFIKDGGIRFDLSSQFSIAAIGPDMKDRGSSTSTSPITSKTEGSPGNKIHKIQWTNAGFVDGDASDFIDFQVWLHEGSNDITIIYGNSSVMNISAAFFGDTGPTVSLYNDITKDNYHLEGDVVSPTMVNSSSLNKLVGIPANGQTYSFENITVGIDISGNKNNSSFNIFPNPVKNELFITNSSGKSVINQLQITTLTGQVVVDLATSIYNETTTISTESLDPGVYFVRLFSNDFNTTHRIVKQ